MKILKRRTIVVNLLLRAGLGCGSGDLRQQSARLHRCTLLIALISRATARRNSGSAMP
jgi:hypothetical protein